MTTFADKNNIKRMKKTIQKLLPAAGVVLAALGIISCNSKNFTVEGSIGNAEDSILYFENVGLEGIQVLDSARLTADGNFSFRQTAPEAPEFYRLRIADQIINISIDSTETVSVKATYPQMATQYDISGSENCLKIKELTLKQIDLHNRVIGLERNNELTTEQVRDSLEKLITAYKEDVKSNYIFREPNKAYAYFALFQTLGQYLIFNPRASKNDVKVFAAVATSWDTYYPRAERGQNLHNIAIEGMKNTRIVEAANTPKEIDSNLIEEAGVIDIKLEDNKGQTRRLTDLKGKVVLLDFHVFALNDSPQRILMLRELYNKYHAQGLEIYQVSFDTDEHFWKQQTAALPWISVRDASGPSSQMLIYYNVPNIPEFFLIDRGNNLVKRSEQMKDVEAEIRALL